MKRCVVVTFLLIMAVSLVNAQSQAQITRREHEFSSKPKSISVTKNEELTIKVTGLGEFGVVAIEDDKTQSSEVRAKAWKLTFSETLRNNATGAPKLDKVTQLPDSVIGYENGILMINGQGSGNTRGVAHIKVPSGMRVTLYVEDRLVRTGVLNGPFLSQGRNRLDNSRGASEMIALQHAILTASNSAPIHFVDGNDSVIQPSRTGNEGRVKSPPRRLWFAGPGRSSD